MSGAAEKYDRLLARLQDLGSLLVAYSGGVDSTLLAFSAHAELGERCAAVLASSNTYPDYEIVGARALAKSLGFRLLEVETSELADPRFAENTSDRCYYCKIELFGLLARVADVEGLAWVADGSNIDDLADHRPGRRAAQELRVVSPLAEAGMTKADIREIARDLGLPNWDKPSMACLATRFPYFEAITVEGLDRVSSAENALRELGLRQFRVRAHSSMARVEVAPDELERAWSLKSSITQALHTAGFTYATLDLDGYRSGSMNAVLPADASETACP